MLKPHYTAGDIGHVRLTGAAMVEICNNIAAERIAWRKAIGVPQGFDIPKKPFPPTAKECRAEIAELEKLEGDAYRLSCSLPPGPERESAGNAMVFYRDRRWILMCAVRDGEMR